MTVLELHGVVGGGLCTYISHRIWWMLCEGHLVRRFFLSNSRGRGGASGTFRIWVSVVEIPQTRGDRMRIPAFALWTFVRLSVVSLSLAAGLVGRQDRRAVESVRSTQCPVPSWNWPGADDWRRVRQDRDDLTARVS